MTNKSVLDEMCEELQRDINRISKRFKRCKVTLIVRNPERPESDVVMGDDEYDQAIDAIQRKQGRKPVKTEERI